MGFGIQGSMTLFLNVFDYHTKRNPWKDEAIPLGRIFCDE
jgi:hypothetical protein